MNYLIDLLFIIGLLLVAAGFFIWHPVIGFVGTGIAFMLVSFLLYRGGE